MKTCKKCIITDKTPGVIIDKNGVCNVCSSWEKQKDKFMDYKPLKQAFINKLNRTKGKYKYDAIVGLSGGKDGAYILHQLKKKHKLNVLALTLDYGFMPNAFAKANAERVVKELDIDHMYLRLTPEVSKKVFGNFLKQFNKITPCNMCSSILLPLMFTKVAIENEIPAIVLGLDRGQLFSKMHLTHNKARLNYFLNPFDKELNYKFVSSFVNSLDKDLTDLGLSAEEKTQILPFSLPDKEHMPEFINFFMFHEYDEDMMKQTIAKEANWQKPDGDSLRGHFDCEVKKAAAYATTSLGLGERLAFEFSVDVREGKMDRSDAIKRINDHVSYVKKFEKPYEMLNKLFDIPEKKFKRKMRKLRILAPFYSWWVRTLSKMFGLGKKIEKMVFWIRPH